LPETVRIYWTIFGIGNYKKLSNYGGNEKVLPKSLSPIPFFPDFYPEFASFVQKIFFKNLPPAS
jgi:hypothetical protein